MDFAHKRDGRGPRKVDGEAGGGKGKVRAQLVACVRLRGLCAAGAKSSQDPFWPSSH